MGRGLCFQTLDKKIDVMGLALQAYFQAATGISNLTPQALLGCLSKEEGPHAHALHFAFDQDKFPMIICSSHLTQVNDMKQ